MIAEPSSADDHRAARTDNAQLLAAAGAVLVLASMLSLVGARWDGFSSTTRLGVALGVTASTVVGARWLRDIAPRTSSVLDALVAALVATDAAAGALVAGAGWREAILTGGLVGVLASVRQRQMGRPTLADVGAVVSLALVAAGVGALTPVTGPAVLAVLAVPLAIRRSAWQRAGWWALAVVSLVPVGRAVDETAFMGSGTLRDVGLLGPRTLVEVVWVAVVVCAALGYLGRTRRSTLFVLAATAAGALHALEIWLLLDPPRLSEPLLAATGLLLFELWRALPAFDRRRHWSDDLALAGLAVLSLAAVGAAVLDVSGLDGEQGFAVGRDWVVTLMLCAATWVIADQRRPAEDRFGPFATFAVLCVSSAAAMLWSPEVAATTWMVGSWFALFFGRPDRWILVFGAIGAAPIIADHHSSLGLAAALANLAVILLSAQQARPRRALPTHAVAAWAHGSVGWWIGLDLLAVEVPVLLVLPVVGALYALLASWQAPGALTASMPLALAAVVAWDGRLDGPDAVHFVTLAVTAIGIGADAVRRADRPAVLVSLATAVATVTYELLSAAGGTGPWAWVGAAGSAALVTAAVVESSEPQRGADVSSSR